MESNITPNIQKKIGKNLHLQKYHPIEIIKEKIYQFFGPAYTKFDNIDPIVSVEDNFDKLLIPKDHPARSKSDTYYVSSDTVLRTHTSAHQNELLSKGYRKFLVTGDVYRKDEVDSHHYPVFHQMEGVCVLENGVDIDCDLKNTLIGLVKHLFPNCQYRINKDYFPFTDPSYEIEVEFNDKWVEILGCGVVQNKILENCGLKDNKAWAFGLGLERLAMILFDIPDIRYFWTTDDAFIKQFSSYDIVKFKPYSVLPPLTKDISFWIPSEQILNNKWLGENDFFGNCREIAKDMIEKIELFDGFYHPGKQLNSRTYHIIYSATDATMNNPGEFNKIVNDVHFKIATYISEKQNLIIR